MFGPIGDPPAHFPDLVGTRFFVTRVVSHHGSFLVADAWDQVQRAKVRLVVFPWIAAADPSVASGVREQLALNASLLHPAIVRASPPAVCGRSLVVVEQPPLGPPLAELLERRRLENAPCPLAQAVEIIILLCDALQFAHRYTCHGFVHPGDVFMRAAPGDKTLVQIGGFGLRAALRAAGKGLEGLPDDLAAYAAPEFLQGGPITPSTDVYGLGAVLYSLLTLQVPRGCFLRPSALRGDIPGPLDGLILRAMDDDPGVRHRSPGDLAGELSSVCGLPGVTSRPSNSSASTDKKKQRAGQAARRRRIEGRTLAWVLLALLNIVLLVAILAGLLSPGRPSLPGKSRAPAGGSRAVLFGTVPRASCGPVGAECATAHSGPAMGAEARSPVAIEGARGQWQKMLCTTEALMDQIA